MPHPGNTELISSLKVLNVFAPGLCPAPLAPPTGAVWLVLCAALLPVLARKPMGHLLSHDHSRPHPLVDSAQCPLCWTSTGHGALRGGPSGCWPQSCVQCPRDGPGPPSRFPMVGLRLGLRSMGSHSLREHLSGSVKFPRTAGQGGVSAAPAQSLRTTVTPLHEARKLLASTPSAHTLLVQATQGRPRKGPQTRERWKGRAEGAGNSVCGTQNSV